MELRHLRYFCAVAENQGFSRTARALHISQSAISEQISSLEKELDVPLLIRGHPKVALTPHGEIFLREAKKVLRDADHAVEMARRSVRGEIGTLTIGFFTGGTGTFVPAMIRSFRNHFVVLRSRILTRYRHHVAGLVQCGDAGAGGRRNRAAAQQSSTARRQGPGLLPAQIRRGRHRPDDGVAPEPPGTDPESVPRPGPQESAAFEVRKSRQGCKSVSSTGSGTAPSSSARL